MVTDDRILSRPGFSHTAHDLLVRGGSAVALHLRGPETDAAELFARGRELREAARESGALLAANDRVDLALVLGLDAVQLGARSLPPAVVRDLVDPACLVGVSVHGAGAARRAEEGGADYLVVGTIFSTGSHPGRPGAGPARVAAVAARVTLPLLAIGGVTPERVAPVLEAGAYGAAVLSGVWDACDPAEALDRYLEALPRERGWPSGIDDVEIGPNDGSGAR